MSKKILIYALPVIAMAGFFLGCGKSGGDTLAVVGDYNISVEEFERSFPEWNYSFSSADFEYQTKREFLDTMVVMRLLIQAAYEKHIDQLEELARIMLLNENKLLLDALYKQHILSKITPTEAEIRDFYNHLEYKVRASHILFDNPDTAQAVLDRILAGESFEKLAYDYSLDNSTKHRKGDLGYFTWGAMVDSFQEAVFKLNPGEITTPIETHYGFHLVKLVDKLPNTQRGPIEAMKSTISNQISQRKQPIVIKEYLDQIKEKFPVKIDTVTCNYLLRKQEIMYPPMLLANLPRNDFDLEQLDRDEKELIIATWEGGQLTVMEYLTQSKQVRQSGQSQSVPPDFDDYENLADYIFALKSSDILILEAHREGIDNTPEYLQTLKLFKELNMADFMRNDSIQMPTPPDENAIRGYYEAHSDEFTQPAKVHVYEILLSDEKKAAKLAKEIKSLEAFKDKAMDLTDRPGKRAVQGDLDYIEEAWFPEIFPVAWDTPVGAIGGPVATIGKYSIFYVIDKIEAQLKDYLGVKRPIIDKLTQEYNAAAFDQWLTERKKSTKVEIYDDAIWETIDKASYSFIDTTSN